MYFKQELLILLIFLWKSHHVAAYHPDYKFTQLASVLYIRRLLCVAKTPCPFIGAVYAST
jgi:hypothetical protein